MKKILTALSAAVLMLTSAFSINAETAPVQSAEKKCNLYNTGHP